MLIWTVGAPYVIWICRAQPCLLERLCVLAIEAPPNSAIAIFGMFIMPLFVTDFLDRFSFTQLNSTWAIFHHQVSSEFEIDRLDGERRDCPLMPEANF